MSNVGVGVILRADRRRLPWVTAGVCAAFGATSLWISVLAPTLWFLALLSPLLASLLLYFEVHGMNE